MDLNEIENEITSLNGLRNDERKNAVMEIAITLYTELKQRGYRVIERDFLKTFFSDAGNNNTQNKTLNEVVAVLKEKGKLTDTDKTKSCIRFLRKELLTNDFNSYQILMQKNGYKTYCYNWITNKNTQTPQRKLLKVFDINNKDVDIINECDLVESKSKTPYNRQGVLSNRSLSIAKSKDIYKVKAFLLN